MPRSPQPPEDPPRRRWHRPVLAVASVSVVALALLAHHRGPGSTTDGYAGPQLSARLAGAPTTAPSASPSAGDSPSARPDGQQQSGDDSSRTDAADATDPTLPTATDPSGDASAYCAAARPGQFTPTSIRIPGVIPSAPVLALARDDTNHPGVPPISEQGKHEFGWDRPPGLMPGTVGGNVLFNAHTWPWTSAEPALGNLMLRGLRPGDLIIVRGAGNHLCYRVTDRVQEPADSSFSRYYSQVGPPQLAIMVCSGERRGPEDWADRTVWYASPIGA